MCLHGFNGSGRGALSLLQTDGGDASVPGASLLLPPMVINFVKVHTELVFMMVHAFKWLSFILVSLA